ncbi:BRO1-like domain-containing protein [Fimicolochytrium jonesii]|uniref:BRO1-like domain-containing protein n=1 Tax=Fimicolochytrium jonesii TaxID=1396493 RepID=UPI0022FE4D67|nr:BRO1-like domain-containing protein [Fimicolochytrium jonesii]KAI8818759.1 BRO1-like domain-containing protein [Fimicolochytrium jonesii]
MLSSDSTVIEGVNHPSFSRFFEAPFSDRIPFQNGPEISFNGEVSTFLAIPIKRNDRLLSANAGESPSGGSFMSLLKAKNKSPVPGGSIGGLKPSSMRFLDFKRALLPSMLMAVRNMQPHGVSEKDGDNASEADGGYGSYRSSSSVTEVAELHTDPTAQPSAMLADMENALANGSSDSDSGIDRTELEKAEERIRVQLLQATGLLLPTDSQWYLLNELRIHAGAPERSEAGIERLSHYYAQLLYLEPKFPFETDEIRMNFNWYEAFFPGRRVITNCIQFEKASVLFNIAAVYTSLALSQSLWTPDGKRKAAKHFQKGAGVLFHIRDRLCARFKPKLDKQSDLSEVTLTAAAELMLAQAMECFYEKATDTKASSGVTAKIAAQTADYYEVASRAARLSTGNYKMRFPETWAQHIKSKTQMFSAIAHMHTAPESAAEAAVGERITRVSIAKELIEQAAKHSKDVGGALHELIQGHAKIIGTAHSFLVHANFERHHHPTFDHRLLPPLKRPQDSLVNPTPLEESIADPRNFPDLFHAIMSPTNHTGIKAILADCKQKIESGRSELLSCVVDIDWYVHPSIWHHPP